MDSLTFELVSNASSQLSPNNTLSSFTNFLPERVNLDGQWEVAISKNPYPSLYQNVTEGNFCFTMRNSPKQQSITIKVSRIMQKVKVYLANEELSLAIFSTDLEHFLGRDVRNDSGIFLCGKGPHETTFAYDIFRIHSLMIYTDILEYNIVGATKALCSVAFHSYPSSNLVT